ncbi:MAG: lysine--tRNA ligase [Anaerolineae bacterium]
MSSTSIHRQQRMEKSERLQEKGIEPYPARVERTHTTAEALEAFRENEEEGIHVAVAGRLMSIRVMGKSTFAHIRDGSGRLQIYLRYDSLGEERYELFCDEIDIGDFIQVEGELFRTRTGETTVQVASWKLLAKALRPLPEKFHGLRDTETRYRQRYLDLIANEDVREIFRTRTRIITALRHFLDERDFWEVETPILQPIYGGAAARPFTTYHNALDCTLYLRIADELYLKRLIIGGFDRVYEIGHNFRNEGISTEHNPEFTVMELYQAYADYHDMMALVEELYFTIAKQVLGSPMLTFEGQEIDLTPPWQRITMRDAILQQSGIDIQVYDEYERLWKVIRHKGLDVTEQPNWGKLVEKLFDEVVEPTLVQPTFIMDYPIEISPLAKKKPGTPRFVERFEHFIGGLECGNAFTELNDPLDQRERFAAQKRAAREGDEEAHPMDEDFVVAMEYGMPPTGGLGIGIDRMIMLFTDQSSIREVILFPLLRQK